MKKMFTVLNSTFRSCFLSVLTSYVSHLSTILSKPSLLDQEKLNYNIVFFVSKELNPNESRPIVKVDCIDLCNCFYPTPSWTSLVIWSRQRDCRLLRVIVQIHLAKWPQLLRSFVGVEQIHSAGIHWMSSSCIFSRSAFNSLNATAISPLTISLSNRWPYWFSIVSAKSIMSSKSSSCEPKLQIKSYTLTEQHI